MNILIIITPYFPAQTPNTLRWGPIMNEFIKKDHSLHVLTTKWSVVAKDTTLSAIKEYRVGHHSLKDALNNVLNIKHRRNNITTSERKVNNSKFNSIVEWVIDKTWRKYYWPDGSCLFLKPGIKKARQIVSKNKISHVISIGTPFTNHLIAFDIKKHFPEIHWHMDVQDPFAISKEFRINNYNRYKDKNFEAESQCLELIDSISFTNSRVKDIYEEEFSLAEKHITCIPPLLEAVEPEKIIVEEWNDNKIHLAYAGNFYEGVRSPEFFCQFLEQLFSFRKIESQNLHFHIYTDLNPFTKSIFSKYPDILPYITFEGYYERESLYSKLKKMHFILNFGNTTDYHLPSKLVELIYLQKPIINFISRNDDVSAGFLSQKVELLNLNLNHIDQSINLFLSFIDREHVKACPDLQKLSDYLPANIAQQYLDALNQI